MEKVMGPHANQGHRSRPQFGGSAPAISSKQPYAMRSCAGSLNPANGFSASRELQTHLGLSKEYDRQTRSGNAASRGVSGDGQGRRHICRRWTATLSSPGKAGRAARKEDLLPTPLSVAFRRAQPLATNLHGALPFRPGVPALDLFPARSSSGADSPRVNGAPTCSITRVRLETGACARRSLVGSVRPEASACSSDSIVVTGGSAEAAFALIARVLLARAMIGSSLRSPGTSSVRAAFLSEGARMHYVPVDRSGIRR